MAEVVDHRKDTELGIFIDDTLKFHEQTAPTLGHAQNPWTDQAHICCTRCHTCGVSHVWDPHGVLKLSMGTHI